MKRVLLLGLLFLLVATEALAWNINLPAGFGQEEFKDLTKELGCAIGYRNLAPAAPLGITGFDVAVQTSLIEIEDNSGYWKKATGDNAPSYITYPSVRVRKGLPLGIDVGAMYTYVAGTDIQVFGAEVSKAILEGSIATPAVGVRATYTKLTGVTDVDLQTVGFDASISKGFIFLTPYAGAGMLYIDGKYNGNIIPGGLSPENMWQPRGFVGLKVTPIPLVGITGEVEYAARPIYSLKFGVSF